MKNRPMIDTKYKHLEHSRQSHSSLAEGFPYVIRMLLVSWTHADDAIKLLKCLSWSCHWVWSELKRDQMIQCCKKNALQLSCFRRVVRDFKKLRRLLQRKLYIKIELCVRLSVMPLFLVDQIVKTRRSVLSPAGDERSP